MNERYLAALHDADVAERVVLIARITALEAAVRRLRGRTHEIQAQEMTKRAALDSQIAEWRQRYEEARQWTEDAWPTPAGYHPFWSTTSYNMRSALLRLVTERNELRATAERLQAEAHEMQCPACGATIRARLADQQGRARDEAGAEVAQIWGSSETS